MSYLSASKLTFSPKWADMSDDEQLAEQVAALDIVAKYGGEIKAQYVLWSDNCLLSVIDYPEEISALKAELAIQRRGAFVLQQQRALPLEDIMSWQDEVRTVTGSNRQSRGWLEASGRSSQLTCGRPDDGDRSPPRGDRPASPRCHTCSMGRGRGILRSVFSKTIAITC